MPDGACPPGADARLPQVRALLGGEASALLACAVAPAGLEVSDARATQVRYDPGRRIVVRYATRVREAGAGARRAGAGRVDTLVALAQRDGLPPGVAVLREAGGHEVGVWRYPNDPWLPGLRTLAYPDGARQVLAQLGATAGGLTVQPLVYRPGQRAVLRVVAGGVELYAKLVRPERAEAIHRSHAALSPHAPVPRSLGWSGEHGLVLLEAVRGDRLADRLSSGAAVPPPAALLALLDRFAGVDVVGGPSGPRGTAHHVRLLRAIVPGARRLVDELAAAADRELPAERTIHGDFYEGQLLVRDGEVTGLLDVDTARPGSVAEDLGTLLAHLDGLALVRPAAAARIGAYRRELERLALERAEAGAIAAVAAGVMLGLATGPFRQQEDGWPGRTRAWLQAGRQALHTSARRRAGGAARSRHVKVLSSRGHGDLTSRRDSAGHRRSTTSRRTP